MDRYLAAALALLLPLAAPGATQAAGSEVSCTAGQPSAAQPGSWDAPVRLVSAAAPSGVDHARLQLGQAAQLALHPASLLALPVPAGREGGNGGLATISIPAA